MSDYWIAGQDRPTTQSTHPTWDSEPENLTPHTKWYGGTHGMSEHRIERTQGDSIEDLDLSVTTNEYQHSWWSVRGQAERATDQIIRAVTNLITDWLANNTMKIVTMLQSIPADVDPLFEYPRLARSAEWTPRTLGYLRGLRTGAQLVTAFDGDWLLPQLTSGIVKAKDGSFIRPPIAAVRATSGRFNNYNIDVNTDLWGPEPNGSGTRRPHGEDWNALLPTEQITGWVA